MGDYTRSEMSRLGHKLGRGQQARKKTELVFLAGVLVFLAGVAGYAIGTFFPYKPTTPEWAEKLEKAAGSKKAPPPAARD